MSEARQQRPDAGAALTSITSVDFTLFTGTSEG